MDYNYLHCTMLIIDIIEAAIRSSDVVGIPEVSASQTSWSCSLWFSGCSGGFHAKVTPESIWTFTFEFPSYFEESTAP